MQIGLSLLSLWVCYVGKAAMIRAPLRLAVPVEQDEHRLAVIGALGEDAFAAAYEDGGAMMLDQAVALAVS